MKDEIKEILDELKDYSEHEYLPPCCELTNEECKQLLDYITNLQEELEEEKRIEEADFKTIQNLEEENERVSNLYQTYEEANGLWIKKYEDYKSRNEKAIEIILKYKELQLEEDYLMNRVNLANYNCLLLDTLEGNDKSILLNTLQGSDKDE